MKPRRLSIIVLGGLALAAGLTASVGAQGQGQQRQEQTIVVYEKGNQGAFRYVDNKPFTRVTRRGPRRISAGDSFTLRNPVYSDAAGTQRAGTLFGSCEAMNASRRFERVTWKCDGVVRLTGGDITFDGIFAAAAETFVFAVTGGTGTYEGANGQITIANQPNEDSIDTIHLLAR